MNDTFTAISRYQVAQYLIGNGPKSPRLCVPHSFVTTSEFLATLDLKSLRDLPEFDLSGHEDEIVADFVDANTAKDEA